MAGAASAQELPGIALAQGPGAADAELSRLQGQRRILIKGGVVLTLDRDVGDFGEADVLIEDGKIREVRPNIAVSGDAAAVVDAANRIVIPGFIDTHSHSYQGLLRNILTRGVLKGFGTPMDAPIGPMQYGYSAELQPKLGYDPQRARRPIAGSNVRTRSMG